MFPNLALLPCLFGRGGEPALAAGSGASAEGEDAIRNGGGSDHESRKHEDLAKCVLTSTACDSLKFAPFISDI